ncbi:hypothetical protein VNO80_20200 [Phaseolus coccineus]|uniref:Uncharacterized protein n=1 Tax=Phaseolus coccineus TaxID=3886 RepID=A0AAN9MHV6_PHACN
MYTDDHCWIDTLDKLCALYQWLIDIRNRRSISLLLIIRFLLVKRWNVIRVHTLQMHYTNRLLKFILVLMRKSVDNCQSIDQVVVMVMEDLQQINDCMALIHLFAWCRQRGLESEVVLAFLFVSVIFGQHQCFLQLVDLAIAVTKTDRELYFICIMSLSIHLNRIEDLEQIALIINMGVLSAFPQVLDWIQ